MGVEADGWIELAQELIAANGRENATVFTRSTTSGYDPNTLSHAGSIETTYTAYAAPVDFTIFQMDKYTINKGEKMLWVPGEDTSDVAILPLVGDTVALEKEYRVLEVTSYETESVNCAFLLKIGV